MSGHYHVVSFPSVEEAAAFVAALSRFVSSPRATSDAAIDVWATLAGQSGAAVYLSDAAVEATAAGFGSPPIAGVRSFDQIRLGAVRVFGGEDVEPLGVADVIRRLT